MPAESLTRQVFRNPIHFLAFGFGSGLAPKAPGTFGTLVGVVLFYYGMASMSIPLYLACVVIVTLSGIWICAYTAEKLNTPDHPGIVWDEIAGFLITMIMAPPGVEYILIGFILFRFFDIVKPWPISWCDQYVKGGLGIMLDDVLAGLIALICLQALFYWVI